MNVAAYTLDDPRPIAAEAPYTYFLPSAEELAALAPGDLVKLIFRGIQPGDKWDAERMWVTLDTVDEDHLAGKLGNQPEDIRGLHRDDIVTLARHHVVDVIWSQDRADAPPCPPRPRDYWQRCLVDRCVIEDGVPVHYLYRDEPEPTSEDGYPDSGWCIRGDFRDLSNEEIDARQVDFVALGLVLNHDDSWLHLIDEPIGSAFIRDWESGTFVPAE